jgi:hypothetical protein
LWAQIGGTEADDVERDINSEEEENEYIKSAITAELK